MLKTTVFRLAGAVLVIVPLTALAQVPAAAQEPADTDFRNIANIPGIDLQEVRDPFSARQIYYIGAAQCTNEEIDAATLDGLDKQFKSTMVVFGDSGAEKDPVADARQQIFGTTEYTDDVRRSLCADMDTPDHPKYTEYVDTVKQFVADYGYTLEPNYRDAQARDQFWIAKMNAFQKLLSRWLSAMNVDLNKLR